MILCPACASENARKERSFGDYVVYLCGDCDLSFAIPGVPVLESSFENYAWTKEWTKSFRLNVKKARHSLSRKLSIIDGFSLKPIRSMLDVGCGNGAFVAAASEIGIDVEGIDVDSEHIRFAKLQGLKVNRCDIQDYQTDRRFDFIHVKESFHLVTRSQQFVGRIGELLNVEGVVYLDSTHSDGLAARYRKIFVRPPRYGQLYPPLHNRAFNKKSLSGILEDAGFRILSLFTFSKGNRTYCPAQGFSLRQCMVNPILDIVNLGGFVGCYATKRRPQCDSLENGNNPRFASNN